uniref:7TM GPCR serpentine receptor class x (Srx) domain-containing protein n=1 Tax=Parascaris equorum TaxID=6256 RepID=A0A914RF77_PAREQ
MDILLANITVSERLTVAEQFFMWLFKITLSVTLASFYAKSMKNSFGYLNISHGVGDCIVLFIFILWYAPMIMIDRQADQTLVALKIAHFTARQLLGALAKPLNSRALTKLPIQLHCSNASDEIIAAPCFYYFDFRHYTWFHADNLCGEFLSWFVDLCYGFVLVFLIGGIDIATFYQLHKAKQAFLSSGIIALIFLAFHLVKKSMAFRFIHFLTGCVCVIIVHGINASVLFQYV